MALDIYRRQARNLAWYDHDGEPSSHNPFKKFRRTPRRTNSIQLEEQRGVQAQSMNDLRLSEGAERRRDFTRDLGGPEASSTFPPESAGSDHPTNGPVPSTQSEAPINGQREMPNDAEESGKPRNRKEKGFFGKFKRSSEQQEPDNSKDPAKKHKFTFASQFRATVLNSWINILIIAAPVGSMFSWLFYCAVHANSSKLRCMPLMQTLSLSSLSTLLLSCEMLNDDLTVEYN